MGRFDDLLKTGLSSMTGTGQQESGMGLATGVLEMLTSQKRGVHRVTRTPAAAVTGVSQLVNPGIAHRILQAATCVIEYVLYNREAGKPFRDLKAGFQRACRRAGISGVTWHTLRHTFPCRLVSRGVDIVTVKELLGRSTVTVTMRYAHTNLASKQEALRSLAPTCDNLVTMPRRERRERKL
jgi:site-specific recombinase XerD